MYALYTVNDEGKKLIGRYDSFTDGALAMDEHRAEHDDNDGYTLIREDDDDGTRV